MTLGKAKKKFHDVVQKGRRRMPTISASHLQAHVMFGEKKAEKIHAAIVENPNTLVSFTLPNTKTQVAFRWDGGRFIYMSNVPHIRFSEVRETNWANSEEMIWTVLAIVGQGNYEGLIGGHGCLSLFRRSIMHGATRMAK